MARKIINTVLASDLKRGMEFNIPAELQAGRVVVRAIEDLSNRFACAEGTLFQLEVEPVAGPFKGQQAYIIVQHNTEVPVLKEPEVERKSLLTRARAIKFGRVIEVTLYLALFAGLVTALMYGTSIDIPNK